jgi:tellurite methyltransferase
VANKRIKTDIFVANKPKRYFMKNVFLTSLLTLLFFFNKISAENESSNSWSNYYQNTINSTDPHKTLLLAYKYFEMENIKGKAADLGAGTGRDTLFLLKSGWQVLSLDAEQLAIDIILNRVDADDVPNLEVQVASFSEMILPTELSLINASYSLPFCKPNDFNECWETIVNSLAEGGRFCGQFFGQEDEWANNPELTIHTKKEVLKLFESRFQIEYLQIEKGLLPCANEKMKQWHVYHVVAKKQLTKS